MTTKNLATRIIGGFFVLATIAVVISWHLIYHTHELDLMVEVRDEAQVGETFQMSVVVRNRSKSETVTLGGFQVDNTYDTGLSGGRSIISSDPLWRSSDPASGSTFYNYDGIDIPPSDEIQVLFTLRADNAGMYQGSIYALAKNPRWFDMYTPVAAAQLSTIVTARSTSIR